MIVKHSVQAEDTIYLHNWNDLHKELIFTSDSLTQIFKLG